MPETTTAGYFLAKVSQEQLIQASSIPYSIVHATQFFEFISSIADASTDGGVVRVPPIAFQPMAADDVAAGVALVAVDSPVNGIVEIGGPEQFRFEDSVGRVLAAADDPREVVADPKAGYFGITVTERTLVPGEEARLGEIRLDDWLRQSAAVATAIGNRRARCRSPDRHADQSDRRQGESNDEYHVCDRRSRQLPRPGSITEREREQIERANATTATPVIFIHGLWLLPSSWDNWVNAVRGGRVRRADAGLA